MSLLKYCFLLIQGRRFSFEEKVIAISIFLQSTRSYNFLAKIILLPSSKTLRRMLNTISLSAGINDIIFQHLTEQGKQLKSSEKLCLLMWDEMSIQPHVQYNSNIDKIIGFEDWGNGRTSADHVLVFMLRGITTGWKIPVTYNFCKSLTKPRQLVRCIREICAKVKRAGFTVVATVCDQSQANIACINLLSSEMSSSGQDIISLYDPPHLLKGIRNNLLTKNLEINVNVTKNEQRQFASWSIIEQAYTMDKCALHTLDGLLPKLTEAHVRKDKIPKMRVKYAAQIFSKTLASHTAFCANIKG